MTAIDPADVADHLARLEAENDRLRRRVDADEVVIRDLLRTIAHLEADEDPGARG